MTVAEFWAKEKKETERMFAKHYVIAVSGRAGAEVVEVGRMGPYLHDGRCNGGTDRAGGRGYAQGI